MNVDSSRSHSIFSIDIEMMESGEDGREKLRAGRLNLVDLAGSERQSKTGSTGEEGGMEREREGGREGGRVGERETGGGRYFGIFSITKARWQYHPTCCTMYM